MEELVGSLGYLYLTRPLLMGRTKCCKFTFIHHEDGKRSVGRPLTISAFRNACKCVQCVHNRCVNNRRCVCRLVSVHTRHGDAGSMCPFIFLFRLIEISVIHSLVPEFHV